MSFAVAYRTLRDEGGLSQRRIATLTAELLVALRPGQPGPVLPCQGPRSTRR